MRWYLIALTLGVLIVLYVLVNPFFTELFRFLGGG